MPTNLSLCTECFMHANVKLVLSTCVILLVIRVRITIRQPISGFAVDFLFSRKNAARRIRRYILSAEYPPEKMARRKFAVYNELMHTIKRSLKLFVKLACVPNQQCNTYLPLRPNITVFQEAFLISLSFCCGTVNIVCLF